MKKNYLIMLILLIVISVGCQKKQNAGNVIGGGISENNVLGQQRMLESLNLAQTQELIDGAVESEEKSGFLFNDETIVNYQEVMELWVWPWSSDIIRNFEVENRVDDKSVPKEIIDILVVINNGNWLNNGSYDESHNESYKDYITDDYIAIAIDDKDKREELIDSDNLYFLEFYYTSSLVLADVDYDNEYEYLVVQENGTSIMFSVYDNMQGEIKPSYELVTDLGMTGRPELLKINNKYFVLAGTFVGFFDVKSKNWHEIAVDRYIVDYTLHEFYSSIQLEEEMILDGVNLRGGEEAGWLMQEKGYFFYDFHEYVSPPMILENEIEGETYYYVFSDFAPHLLDDENDKILYLVKENNTGKYEIVKAYYLVADLKLVIEEK